MYDFHYNYIKPKYSESTLLFTDTDSLTYQIQTDNVYEDFYAINVYSISLGMSKKVHSMMIKDELNGEIIEELVGLRAKMYSLKTKKKEMKKAKGVKKKVVKKEISHQDFVDCLFDEGKFMHTMQTKQSFKHQLYTIKQNKVFLSPYDDRRYLMNNGVSSLPYGHCCCKYLGNLSIIFSETFVIYFNF